MRHLSGENVLQQRFGVTGVGMGDEKSGAELLRQEVIELTDLMRTDSDFSDIRKVVIAKGLSLTDTFLVGLIGGEDGHHYGALVTDSGQCITFLIDSAGRLAEWNLIDDISALSDDFDAVAIGVQMKLDSDAHESES
jgi:hypothetical protein